MLQPSEIMKMNLAMQLEAVAVCLADQEWAVDPTFIAPELAAALREDAAALKNASKFNRAAVGKNPSVQSETRSDEILWFEPTNLTSAQAAFWNHLEEFRKVMNEKLFLGLNEFEAHFACYEKGAFYAKHVDRFRDDDRRVISMVVYLNDAWSESDGGFLNLSTTSGVHSVSPNLGLMVCFKSDRIEHEVKPAQRTRWSIAVWFKRSGPQAFA
jgi:SM-20-related protein